MKILFASLPAYGHLYPLMPLALACADAGHDVTVATGAPFVGQLPLPTIQSVPPDADIDGLVAETRRRHQEATGDDLVVGMFADVSAEAISDILLRQLKDGRPDLIIYEAMNAGAGVAASVLGIPALAFAISITHGGYSSIHPATVGFRQRVWAERGLKPPLGTPLLAEALLDPAPPSLQSLSGPYDMPKIPIRSQAWTGGTAPVSDWLRAPKTRPRIYLTLGTVSFGAVEVLRRVIDDLTNLDLDLLVAVGPEGDPAAVGKSRLMSTWKGSSIKRKCFGLVDVVVHHGGTGTVLGAFEAGVPQLILLRAPISSSTRMPFLGSGQSRRSTTRIRSPERSETRSRSCSAPDRSDR